MTARLLLLLVSVFSLAGCELQQAPEPVTSRNARESAPALPVTRTVGTGRGNLLVDGKTLNIKPGEVVAITPGTYSGMTFTNLIGRPGYPIQIVANALVEIAGGGDGISLRNIAYLTVDGGAKAKNLLIRDNWYRAVTISGSLPRALTLQGIRFRNIADYSIFCDNKTKYDRTDATAFTDFKLLNCDFDHAGSIQFSGDLTKAPLLVNNGFMRNPEVGYCTFKNSPDVGTVLYFGNVENINVHHNVVDNVNTANNNHNGIFLIKGNGSVHHNKCTNHQGNMVRFWPFSQGTTPKEVLLYDNIVWNSRKYSAMELQSFATNLIPGVSTYCNAKVFNNTAGHLNTSRDYVGVVLDVYSLYGGTLQVFNNLSFDQASDQRNDGIYSQQSDTRPSLYVNNRYFSTASAAGLADLVNFRLMDDAPIKSIGMAHAYLTSDFYDARRGASPSVGAVE